MTRKPIEESAQSLLTSVTQKNVPIAVVIYYWAWYVFLRDRCYQKMRCANLANIHCGNFQEIKAEFQKRNQNLEPVVFKDQIRDRNLNSIEVLAKNVSNGIFLSLYQDFQTLHLDAKMVMMRAAAKPNMGSTGALCSLMYLGEHFQSFKSF